MQHSLKMLVSLGFLVVGTNTEPVQAVNRMGDFPLELAHSSPAFKTYHREIEKRIYKNLVDPNSSLEGRGGVIAGFALKKDGKIRDVSIGQSSGKNASDFACFEAILGSSPLSAAPSPENQREQWFRIDFYESRSPYFEPAIRKADLTADEFYKNNPSLKARAVPLHLIPLDVLTRYPGIFSETELIGLGNLKAIPIDGLISIDEEATTRRTLGNLKVKEFFHDWENFFETHVEPKKADIVSFRDELIKKYSSLFIN
ncbi:MAG: hypothetical protein C0473_02720 [Cyanobacteria bacterium DS3.002]|nr:hypothetical protein [Cyanobacteria bacterium DS3.002]MBA4049729.1 hypothetical protein [Cyanobacteria bacterium DS2.008]MBA4073418.1 hypothetical protein [Cyanobacteria bacterium PR.023]